MNPFELRLFLSAILVLCLYNNYMTMSVATAVSDALRPMRIAVKGIEVELFAIANRLETIKTAADVGINAVGERVKNSGWYKSLLVNEKS
jgi:hypothetical protein